MKRVHFIAIGGAAMHNLALALHRKAYHVTGSDDEIFDPARIRLQAAGLLPEKAGWFPEKLTADIEAVIVGMHAREDNPELQRAQELGLRIYSFPEYLYEQTQDKLRVVIGGSHGKTSITAMILFVLKRMNMAFDYMVGAQIEGFDTMVGLSDSAPIAIFEGDEYLTSPLDLRPKFHLYQPHIAVVSGIAWDHINVFPTFDNYVEQFRIFADTIMPNGSFIYFEQDENLQAIARTLRADVTAVAYDTHPYRIEGGKTLLLTAQNNAVPLHVFGEHNLQNISAAHAVCRALGVSDADFYAAIADFNGAANRLQKIAENDNATAFKDFAHSPSKLRATVEAVCKQFPDRILVACMELHTFSSLTDKFLLEYKGCMRDAHRAFVYFNPDVLVHKKLPMITPEQVQTAFGGNVEVFTDSQALQTALKAIDFREKTLLMMSSGNFDGMDVVAFAQEVIGR